MSGLEFVMKGDDVFVAVDGSPPYGLRTVQNAGPKYITVDGRRYSRETGVQLESVKFGIRPYTISPVTHESRLAWDARIAMDFISSKRGHLHLLPETMLVEIARVLREKIAEDAASR